MDSGGVTFLEGWWVSQRDILLVCIILVALHLDSRGAQRGLGNSLKPPKYINKASLKSTIKSDYQYPRSLASDKKNYYFILQDYIDNRLICRGKNRLIV